VRFLHVDRARCTGCRVCEYACALEKQGVANPAWSRIRVQRPEVLRRHTLVCLQCQKPRCMEACPTGAIRREGDQISVDAQLCDRCGACVVACGRLFLPPGGPVVMCDQCGACVSRCPEGALVVTTAEELRRSRKRSEK
jgi:Fe-S-cluster-containing hydrogenase component 2